MIGYRMVGEMPGALHFHLAERLRKTFSIVTGLVDDQRNLGVVPTPVRMAFSFYET